MNNGKIRIYDLSKELNLDNRDILNICEQLNIAVKSHSSTINENEVQQIREKVKTYTVPKRRPTINKAIKKKTRHGENSGKPASRKPQIRGLVKNKPIPRESVAPANSPRQPQSANMELAAPPARPGQSRPAPSNTTTARSTPPTPAIVSPPPAVQELVAPPSRPNKPSGGNSAASQETTVTKTAPPKRQNPSASSATSARKEGKTESVEESEKVVLRKPSSPEQQKPEVRQLLPKPSIKSETEPETTAPTETVETSINEPELLKPPARPAKPKRTTAGRPEVNRWVEDDEGDKAAKGTKGKAATKKRKSPRIEEDDDEFDLETGESNVNAVTVSLSMARPPKPSKPKTTTPPPAAKAKTRKRPSRDQRSQERQRVDNSPEQPPEIVSLTGSLSMRELSTLVKISETEIIRRLFTKGIAINITQTLDLETCTKVIEELGILVDTPEQGSAATKTEMLDVADLEKLQTRPPVVTIMGHVDHGKTTLLDSIRKTKVAQGEAGGITQHIGAYHVDVEHNSKLQQVVFLDTPGHEAFTAMRARGTRVTDIAILVVAADDGVQPQTKEAISHARAAEVPLIVAINKVDKPEAQPDRIRQELAEQGLVAEDWGGDTIMVPVSAIQGDNLDTLLEMILLVSELEELSANPERPAKGTVIEAHLDKTRGPVATLLVQNGTLRVGDSLVAGSAMGKIRAMIDDRGDRVEQASPSFAVEVLGMNDVPEAGDEFDVYPSDKEARAVADDRAAERRESRLQQAMSRRVTLSSLSAQAQEGELKELNLILKADVQGSVEAIVAALDQLPQNEVQLRVLMAAPGEVTETDVDLAAASGAVIIGFNTDLAAGVSQAADREQVSIQEYNIIYNLLDDVQGAMEGLLDPEEVEEALGTVEVRAVFPVGRGSVAGCYITSGKVIRNRRMRVLRGDKVVFDGPVDSLKRIKEDVREVKSGFECGIGSDKFNDWTEGDRIEAYQMVMKRRTLSAK
ncbi:MAG: translation initiation factor IF-2 [Spirulina sp. SIO3F2]|nr:translation initiation factor IF-2 [Spirulina sp. SIO3F2]